MGFFDRLRNFANRLIGRPETPPEISTDPTILENFGATEPARQSSHSGSVLDHARSFFSGIFKRIRQPEIKMPNAGDLGSLATNEERQEEIFKYRRTSEREGKGRAFYRLTQSIWDRPGISMQDRDKAIQDYFRDRYGISNMNSIYDKVLNDNAEALEEYNNAPNAAKYDALKRINVKATAI